MAKERKAKGKANPENKIGSRKAEDKVRICKPYMTQL